MKEQMNAQASAKIIERVYHNFLRFENEKGWNDWDDKMEAMEWFQDHELHREVDDMFEQQMRGNPNCGIPHSNQECFVPVILEAVRLCMIIFKRTGQVTPMTRFIMRSYLVSTYMGKIQY